uniref:Uncharacterized protein n=1 Tax=Nelumbo nucifera TaxID=4432 RepID=A0A822XFI9_NELNU|nr:TPA_asm: hypothetical protein HUJ06_020613 [Nelumbo nucifera]
MVGYLICYCRGSIPATIRVRRSSLFRGKETEMGSPGSVGNVMVKEPYAHE